MSKILFMFEEDDVETRRTLAAALEDEAWLSSKKRPVLELGFDVPEKDAMFLLVKATGQHGAHLLVVGKSVEDIHATVESEKEEEEKEPVKRTATKSKSKEVS